MQTITETPKKLKLTPFGEILEQSKQPNYNNLPVVIYDGKRISAIKYQLAISKMQLSLSAKGIQPFKNWKLKDHKNFYGLKGRTAKDCLEEFMIIYNHFFHDQEV